MSTTNQATTTQPTASPATPAPSPTPLASTTGAAALAAAATPVLDQIRLAHGTDAARFAALAFLAHYFQDEGQPDEDPRLAQLRVQVADLRVALDRVHTAAQQAEGEALVRRLKRDAADAQVPLAEADLARVAALVKRRDLDLAKALGDALLGRSLAQHQTTYRRGARVRLEETQDPQKSSAEAQARVLRAHGWTVELNADGTEITRAAPDVGA